MQVGESVSLGVGEFFEFMSVRVCALVSCSYCEFVSLSVLKFASL